jgi:two-component system alkaline phosphatase synthesis response regulator PhoP
MTRKQKILIVEDTKSYLFIISQKLEEAGFLVVTAGDGEEGLDVAEKEKPDLILLDVEMPKMDGITMSKKLRESGEKTPIIFLTNMGDLKHISEAVEASADYIIKSEVSSDEIVSRVKERLATV